MVCCGRGSEGSRDISVRQRICIVEKDWLILCDAVMLQVGGDGIADGDTVSVVDGGNRNECFKLIADVNLACDVHRGISRWDSRTWRLLQ